MLRKSIFVVSIIILAISCRPRGSNLSEVQSGSSDAACNESVKSLVQAAGAGDQVAMQLLELLAVQGVESASVMVTMPVAAQLAAGASAEVDATSFHNRLAGGKGSEFDAGKLEQLHSEIIAGQQVAKWWEPNAQGQVVGTNLIYGMLEKEIEGLSKSSPAEVLETVNQLIEMFANSPVLAIGGVSAVEKGIKNSGQVSAELRAVAGPLTIALAERHMVGFVLDGAKDIAKAAQAVELMLTGMAINRQNEVGAGVKELDNRMLNKYLGILKSISNQNAAPIVQKLENAELALNGGDREAVSDAAGYTDTVEMLARNSTDVAAVQKAIELTTQYQQILAKNDPNYAEAARAWVGAKAQTAGASSKVNAPKIVVASAAVAEGSRGANISEILDLNMKAASQASTTRYDPASIKVKR